jgi:hypothetical protein
MTACSEPRPITRIGRIAQWALLFYFLNLLILATLTGLEMSLIKLDLNGVYTADWLWDLSYDAQTWTGWSSVIIFVLTGIPFLRWQFIACHNAWFLRHRQGHSITGLLAPSPHITPGWSVAYYFIPIVSLWKPYSAMKQINAASAEVSGISVARLLPFWWFLWLTDGLGDPVLAKMWENADSNEEMFKIDVWYAISYFFSALLTYLAFLIVNRITKAQLIAIDHQPPALDPESAVLAA